MIRTLYHILAVYWKNQGFRLLFGAVVITGLVSKISYHTRLFPVADDVFTLFFIFSLWLAFHFGIIIKRQFAVYQARILPAYRPLHVVLMLAVYALVIGLDILWGRGVALGMPWLPKFSMTGVWGTCLLVSLFVILLGYFSVGRFLLYGYCLLLVGSAFLTQVLDVYKFQPFFVYIPFILWVGVLGVFLWRLFALREDFFEYPHLLTWPLKNSLGWYRGPSGSRAGARRARTGGEVKYHNAKNILERIEHWNLSQGDEPELIVSVGWVALGIYLLVILRVSWVVDWLRAIYGNFFLFTITPLVIVAVRHYKQLVFWGYDILRPVKKEQYIRDQFTGVFAHAFAYWILTVTFLGLIPAKIFYPAEFFSLHLIGYFLLSGSLLFLTLAVLIVLMTKEKALAVIIPGGLLSAIINLLFGAASDMGLMGYFLSSWVCLASGLIFIKHGYHAWCQKEYV